MNELARIIGTVAFICVGVVGCGPTETFPPPQRSDVIGSWTGAGGRYSSLYYRVTLSEDGDGLFATTWDEDDTTVYRIVSWRLGDEVRYTKGDVDSFREIVLDTELLGGGELARIVMEAGRNYIRVNAVPDRRSRLWVYLVREGPAEQRARRTREAMARYQP